MSRMITWMAGLSLVIGMLLPSAALAVVVTTNNDMPNSNGLSPGDNVFRTFPYNGWTGSQDTATDGNNVLNFNTPLTNSSNSGSGYVWHLNAQDYADALGNPGGATTLQNNWVVRQSVWIALDPNDPLLNEGDWTDSLKFEFATNYGGSGGAELFDTGSVFPSGFYSRQL